MPTLVRRRRAPTWIALLCTARLLAGGGVRAQALEVRVDTARVTVGDPVTVTVSARLPARAELLDRTPHAREALPDGVRLLSADTLPPRSTGTITARLRFAFFRPGPQRIPSLVMTYRVAGGAPSARADSLVSQPVPVEVASVLPATNYGLRDIKGIEAARFPLRAYYVAAALLLAALLLAWAALRRRTMRRRIESELRGAVPPPPPTPYDTALEALATLEAERLPARGEIARHYTTAADVLRRYLEEAHGVPALERTTTELLWALPPELALADGDAAALLAEADLVKFARLAPGELEAASYLIRAREQLERWHSALVPNDAGVEADAAR